MANKTEQSRSISRREALKLGVGTGLGTLAARVFGGTEVFKPQVARAEDLPTDIGERLEFFPLASESVTIDEKGVATFTTSLKKGEIFIANSQKIETAGVLIDVDPSNNPDKTAAVAVIAFTDMDLKYSLFPKMSAWKGKEKSKSNSFEALVEDALRAAKVQGTRSRIPGNCDADGCNNTRIFVAGGHRDADGETRFDLIMDKEFSK